MAILCISGRHFHRSDVYISICLSLIVCMDVCSYLFNIDRMFSELVQFHLGTGCALDFGNE